MDSPINSILVFRR